MKYKNIYKYQKDMVHSIAMREIEIPEMENERTFVKYTTLENNHFYGTGLSLVRGPFFPLFSRHKGPRGCEYL